MRSSSAVAVGGVMVLLAGCATSPKVVVQDRVGPCHRVSAEGASAGLLQVFSARERAPSDVNAEEFLVNNDFGKNAFLYDASHSDYTVLDRDGLAIKVVRNSPGGSEAGPATTVLPEGSYSIEAQAEDLDGTTVTVVVPLVIEAGQMTTVHLEPGWRPLDETLDASGLVRLADGRVLGCRADHLITRQTTSRRPIGFRTDSAGMP